MVLNTSSRSHSQNENKTVYINIMNFAGVGDVVTNAVNLFTLETMIEITNQYNYILNFATEGDVVTNAVNLFTLETDRNN